MTTVVEVLARAARQCSIVAPSSWVSSTDDEHVELRDDFLLETVDDIQARVDLPSPIGKQTTISGDGSEQYTLPTNFVRTQRDQLAVYDTQQDSPAIPVTDDGMWTYIKDIGTSGVRKYYKIEGYEGNYTISIYSNPSSDLTVSYISDVWMKTDGGTEGNAFTAEDDVILLPRRVVEAGIIWRWRERRGLPYEDKYNEYEALIARLSNDTRGRRVIDMGQSSTDVRWQDLVPSFIPAS